MSAAHHLALARILRAEMAHAGPIGVDRFMALALGHPQHGYYITRDPLGVQGDFTTAPEISQMFGELIGLWLAQCWLDAGAPSPFALVELGPGRGTLMRDALRAARSVPRFHAAMRVFMVETSPVLRQKQVAALAGYQPAFVGDVDDLPDLPLFVVGNEFIDALPVSQYQLTVDGWRERLIRAAADDDSKFEWVLGPVISQNLPRGAPIGAIWEDCPLGRHIAARLAIRLRTRGGAALLVDYGYDGVQRARAGWPETLQALRAHAPVSVFDTPGSADLTTHVDFDALARAARSEGVAAHGPITQGVLLGALGIETRAAQLIARNPDQAEMINAALTRLMAPDQMGVLFKALALTPGPQPPPGFGG